MNVKFFFAKFAIWPQPSPPLPTHPIKIRHKRVTSEFNRWVSAKSFRMASWKIIIKRYYNARKKEDKKSSLLNYELVPVPTSIFNDAVDQDIHQQNLYQKISWRWMFHLKHWNMMYCWFMVEECYTPHYRLHVTLLPRRRFSTRTSQQYWVLSINIYQHSRCQRRSYK